MTDLESLILTKLGEHAMDRKHDCSCGWQWTGPVQPLAAFNAHLASVIAEATIEFQTAERKTEGNRLIERMRNDPAFQERMAEAENEMRVLRAGGDAAEQLRAEWDRRDNEAGFSLHLLELRRTIDERDRADRAEAELALMRGLEPVPVSDPSEGE